MIKFRKTKEKEKGEGGHNKTAATKRLSFFLSIKAYVKSISEFRIKKYADKGGFALA